MRRVNLTPHPVHLLAEDGQEVVIPPSGIVCRAAEIVTTVGEIVVDGVTIPLRRIEYGPPEGLPDPEDGVGYIVSVVAAQAIRRHYPHRQDIFVSTDFARNDQGRIVGARALAIV